MTKVKTMDTEKMIESYRRQGTKPQSEWVVEESKKFNTVYSHDPIYIERTRKNGTEIRSVRLRRGHRNINFDIESAQLLAYEIKLIAGEYVPKELTEEEVRKQ